MTGNFFSCLELVADWWKNALTNDVILRTCRKPNWALESIFLSNTRIISPYFVPILFNQIFLVHKLENSLTFVSDEVATNHSLHQGSQRLGFVRLRGNSNVILWCIFLHHERSVNLQKNTVTSIHCRFGNYNIQ